MGGGLDYVYEFRSSKELTSFLKKKRKDKVFINSPPTDFSGEFIPLCLFSHFFSKDIRFRLVRHENTIKDALIKSPDGGEKGIQITQAMDENQRRNFIHHIKETVIVHGASIDKSGKSKNDRETGGCTEIANLDSSSALVLEAIRNKIKRYQSHDSYPSHDTLLLVFLSEHSIQTSFPPKALLTLLRKSLQKEEITFFENINILYPGESVSWYLLDIGKNEVEEKFIDLTK